MRNQVRRTLVHADMKGLCRQFAGRAGQPGHLRSLVILPLEPGLVAIAARFILRQEARRAADYDLGRSFTRRHVLRMVGAVQSALDDWARIRMTPDAAAFLTALLLNKQWGRS